MNGKTSHVYELEGLVLLRLQYASNWPTDLTPNMDHLSPFGCGRHLIYGFYCSNHALAQLPNFRFLKLLSQISLVFTQAAYSLCLDAHPNFFLRLSPRWSSGLSLQTLFSNISSLIDFEEDKYLLLCVPLRPILTDFNTSYTVLPISFHILLVWISFMRCSMSGRQGWVILAIVSEQTNWTNGRTHTLILSNDAPFFGFHHQRG